VSTEVATYGLKRQLSRLNILQITINSIIGTGWLFSSMNAASIAGPSALIAWVCRDRDSRTHCLQSR
jgi:amino acid transporter